MKKATRLYSCILFVFFSALTMQALAGGSGPALEVILTSHLAGGDDSGSKSLDSGVANAGNFGGKLTSAIDGHKTLTVTATANGGCRFSDDSTSKTASGTHSGSLSKKTNFDQSWQVKTLNDAITACALNINVTGELTASASYKYKIKQYADISASGVPGTKSVYVGQDQTSYPVSYTVKNNNGTSTKESSGNNPSFVASGTCKIEGGLLKVSDTAAGDKCVLTAKATGNTNLAHSTTKTLSYNWKVNAVVRDEPYQINAYNDGTPVLSSTRFTTETPNICSVQENGVLKARTSGACKIRVYDDSSYTLATWTILGDVDGDGVPDNVDNCPQIPNKDQYKTLSTSSKGDACNDDWDGDGILNADDNCPYTPNNDQAESEIPGIGLACFDASADTDGDGVLDIYDNCPFVRNGPSEISDWIDVGAGNGQFNADGTFNVNGRYIQRDTDGDGRGDACDDDIDGDEVPNEEDNCPYVPNADQADQNNNGIGDVCEPVFAKPLSAGGVNRSDCGTSWANACADIQKAIDATTSQRNQIFLQEGVYHPSTTINLKKGIVLIGGFKDGELQANKADGTKNLTIISGGSTASGLSETVEDAALYSPKSYSLFSASEQGKGVSDMIEIVGLTFNGLNPGNNTAALHINNSRVLITASQFVANYSGGGTRAAAIIAENTSELEVRASSFRNNRSSQGSAIDNRNSKVKLNDVKFIGNNTTGSSAAGAAIYQEGSDSELEIKRGVFENNYAFNGKLNGGAIASKAGLINISNGVIFKENEAENGGAIFVSENASLTIEQAEFVNNKASNQAGAAYLSATSNNSLTQTIQKSLFANNEAVSGDAGAIYSDGATKLLLQNNTFFANSANGGAGGAMYLNNTGVSNILFNTISRNSANSAAGVRLAQTGAVLKGNLIAGNLSTANSESNVVSGSNLTNASKYNLFGHSDNSGSSGVSSANGVIPSEALNKIVVDSLALSGGDGYVSTIKTLPIVGGGPARDAIPGGDCVADDMRGEARPDVKSTKSGTPLCDIGAYEFTVLTCEEDAERRYNQGERFIKSCAKGFENFELGLGGSANIWWLMFITLIGLFRVLSSRKPIL